MQHLLPRRALRAVVSLLSAGALAWQLSGCAQPATPTAAPVATALPHGSDQRPNILIILTDDQRCDTMDFMPETKSLILDRGTNFVKAYATTPLCCPSRSSILTGMYAHQHKVLKNDDPLHETTVVERLHADGYYTGMIGKYLNSWDGSARPEFDFWVASDKKQYNNPSLNVNGEWTTGSGYATDLFGQYALEFLDKAAGQRKPWMLLYSVRAPHEPAVPADKYKDLYADLPPFRPPSFNEADMSDKLFNDGPALLTQEQIAKIDAFRLDQLRTLKSVDDTVGAIMGDMDKRGMLNNTAIFFMSDNGLLLGEHRQGARKVLPFEPSIRVPFAFYYPKMGIPASVSSKLVANIDVAPTMYQLAGITQPSNVDGLSLIPLLRNEGTWRDTLLIESWGYTDASPDDTIEPEVSTGTRRTYLAVHTERYVLIEYIDAGAELYDLEKDPDQLQNVYKDPEYAQVVKDLTAKFEAMKGPYLALLPKSTDAPAPTAAP